MRSKQLVQAHSTGGYLGAVAERVDLQATAQLTTKDKSRTLIDKGISVAHSKKLWLLILCTLVASQGFQDRRFKPLEVADLGCKACHALLDLVQLQVAAHRRGRLLSLCDGEHSHEEFE